MRDPTCHAAALEVFETVCKDFPAIQSKIDFEPHIWVEIRLTFEQQPALRFPVVATLQNEDELHLYIGDVFWCEWFPARDSEVRQRFERALRGVLRGEMRVAEYRITGRPVKAHIQELVHGEWKRVATWSKLHWPSWRKREIAYLQNRML